MLKVTLDFLSGPLAGKTFETRAETASTRGQSSEIRIDCFPFPRYGWDFKKKGVDHGQETED